MRAYVSVPDETLFYRYAAELRDALVAADWATVADFGNPYGYGSGFWLFSALVLVPFGGATVAGLPVLVVLFAAMKWISLGLVADRALSRGPIAITALFATFLGSSITWFYGKIYGPDLFIVLVGALCVWLLLLDRERLGRFLAGGWFAAALGTTTKATAGILLCLVFGYTLMTLIRAPSTRCAWRATLACGAGLLSAAVVSAPLLLTERARAESRYWLMANTDRDFGVVNLRAWISQNNMTWDAIPQTGFMGVTGAFAATCVTAWWIIARVRRKQFDAPSRVGALCFAASLLGVPVVAQQSFHD